MHLLLEPELLAVKRNRCVDIIDDVTHADGGHEHPLWQNPAALCQRSQVFQNVMVSGGGRDAG
jgi:hypothetical protein